MMEDYKIKLESFEGPMDLLLFLIKKNKVDIYDIPIAEITEQYLAYLSQFREFNIEVASEFLVLAATLLLIKSRMMLPKQMAAGDEPEEEEDPRQELVERILEYRRYKEVSDKLDKLAEQEKMFFTREPLDLPVKHLPPGNLSLDKLVEAFKLALSVREELSIPDAIVAQEEYDVEEQAVKIMDILSCADGRVLFEEIFTTNSRQELIVTFLALLELIRRKSVYTTQSGTYGEIYIFVRQPDKLPKLGDS